MKIKIPTVARFILGFIYFVFGLNGFLNFLKMTPPPMSDVAMGFVSGLMKSGYFMKLVSGTQASCGFLLLTGFAAPLALVILASMTLNIFLFHFFLTPGLSDLILPIVMVALHITAAIAYWPLYHPLFSKK